VAVSERSASRPAPTTLPGKEPPVPSI